MKLSFEDLLPYIRRAADNQPTEVAPTARVVPDIDGYWVEARVFVSNEDLADYLSAHYLPYRLARQTEDRFV